MPRRGFILIEIFAACGLIALLLALSVQVLSTTALERRYVERRVIAQQQAANLMERALALPYAELNDEQLATLAVPDDVAQMLPGLETKFRIQDDDAEVPSKQVTLELRWHGPGQQPQAPVRINAWAFAPVEATPDTPLEAADETKGDT